MTDSGNPIVDMFAVESRRIKSGYKYPIRMMYCTACKRYKRLSAQPIAAPGGTPSCPICRELKLTPPGIEGSYGMIKVKVFDIILPKEVDGY